jgi:hypothetical protein
MNAALFAGFGSVASFKTQVSRTMRKVRAGHAQRVFPPLALHETDGLRLAQAPAFVLFPDFGKTRRKLQLDQLSANNGADIHVLNLARA